jgi:hypothetical protein
MDPGGGYGQRPYGLGRRALRAPQDPRTLRPIGVLLLPRVLERFALRAQAADLMRAPGVVAIEPARMSYESYLRLPLGVGDGIAAIQAKRLSLPGLPHVALIFSPLQYPLARALIAEHPECELWYAPEEREPEKSRKRRERLQELDLAASERAALRFSVDQLRQDERFPAGGWARLEKLGIESGRLGSERPDVNPDGIHG